MCCRRFGSRILLLPRALRRGNRCLLWLHCLHVHCKKQKAMPSGSHSFESCKSITISYLVSFSPSARSMQIQARQNMPLAGFYGSELMNAANEAGWRQQGRGPGHYFAHVPAPASPFPFPFPSPSPTAMHCGLVSLWLHGTPLVGPQTTAAAVRNNSNNLSPRTQIMHELNCAWN